MRPLLLELIFGSGLTVTLWPFSSFSFDIGVSWPPVPFLLLDLGAVLVGALGAVADRVPLDELEPELEPLTTGNL
jgi:hypothetical protein